MVYQIHDELHHYTSLFVKDSQLNPDRCKFVIYHPQYPVTHFEGAYHHLQLRFTRASQICPLLDTLLVLALDEVIHLRQWHRNSIREDGTIAHTCKQ
jgi:hypothetical protein